MKPLPRCDAELSVEEFPVAPDQVETRVFGVSRNDVAAIDAWLEQIGARWGVNERTMFGARLCIAELAANTLEHGVAISAEDHTIVTARCGPLGIALEFLDSRAPFDPTAKPARQRHETLESADAGGRGLSLIHSYADKLTYSHDGTYNRVGLLFHARHND
jgi:anti-sigma regulatory factor (Ser/Thr protein kinase)